MVLVIIWSVTARRFGVSTFGATELVRLAMIPAACAGIAYVQSLKGHVRVDFIVTRLPKKVQFGLECMAWFLALAVCGIIGWQFGLTTRDYIVVGDYYPGVINFVWWPWFLVATLGFLFLIIWLLTHFIQSIRQTFRG